MFTPEELAEIAAADAEIEASFALTCQDIRESNQRDRRALFDRKDRNGQIKSAYQREYREINREKFQVCGAQIREWRHQEKLSQTDVAKAIGVSKQAVSKWETGRSPADIAKLAKVFPGIIGRGG